MATLNPLERLEQLSQQRTARTDRLEAAVHALLRALDKVTKPGDSVKSAAWSLTRYRSRTNVGVWDHWVFANGGDYDDYACDLDEAVGSERYIHGDFHCQAHGPDREDLILFAGLADKFVAEFIRKLESEGTALDDSAAKVEALAESMQ